MKEEEEKKALDERKHGLDLAFQVLSAQPRVIMPSDDAYRVATMVVELAELLFEYEKTGKIPMFSPRVVSEPDA
jgi:hypothetical protein